MKDLIVFNSIPVSIPKDRVYKRLGYRRDKTRLSSQQRMEIEQYMQEFNNFIKLKGVAKRISIKEKNNLEVVLINDVTFESKHLAALLKDCLEVLFMGVTAGGQIIEQIQKDSSQGNLTKAVVFDAVASEVTDTSLDWICGYINQQLRRENKCLTRRRFSAGYGDFILENQKTLYNTLELKKLGVSITESYMLTPEKSVIAVAGILYRDESSPLK
ncbi:MAG: methionine synthase [Candidatus Omnitrophota bacterium]|nr:MAG: methionine synthase [Candidatus Omnitrophota bacterium]